MTARSVFSWAPVAGVAAIVGLLTLAVLFQPGRAPAMHPVDLITSISCSNVTLSQSFSPGITATTQAISQSGSAQLASCFSSGDPSVTSGTASFSNVQGSASCTSTGSAQGSFQGTIYVAWTDSLGNVVGTSVLNGNPSSFTKSGVGSPVSITSNLTVASGMFAGGNVAGQQQTTQINPSACSTTGVTTAASTGSSMVQQLARQPLRPAGR